MARALILYTSRSGGTEKIAELIAEGIRFSGSEAEVMDAGRIKDEATLEGYDAYVLGSATYHGDMMKPMKTLLFFMEKAGPEGKAGGSFGAFGWSGEAPVRIFDTMKNIFKMDLVSGPLMLKSASLGGGTKMAQDYGKEIAKKMAG